jgi:hypothetical protein
LDFLQYLFDAPHDIGVGESEDPIAARLQPLCPLGVIHFSPGVEATVDFDEKLSFKACKVDDEGANWHLAAKAAVFNLGSA